MYYVALPETPDLSKETRVPTTPEEERSADSLYPDGEKKSTIKKLLGRSFARQTSFTMEEPKKVNMITLITTCVLNIENNLYSS